MTTPSIPNPPWFDTKTGNPTEPFRRFIAELWQNAGAPESTLSTNITSGVAAAQAAASAAQATANAAQQQANDVGAGALPFSASASPASATGSGLSGTIETNTVTVTPAGGTGPYTYAWAYVSGDAVTVQSPTAATTKFSSLTSAESVYRCTVTDFLLATAVANVGVSISVGLV